MACAADETMKRAGHQDQVETPPKFMPGPWESSWAGRTWCRCVLWHSSDTTAHPLVQQAVHTGGQWSVPGLTGKSVLLIRHIFRSFEDSGSSRLLGLLGLSCLLEPT